MDSFYALIVPMAPPGSGTPGEPPSIWPSPGYPAHPIAPGGPPPGIWPGRPEHPIYWPPSLWPQPGRPVHPIVLPEPPPGAPPGIWGGSNEPFPTPPIFLPPVKPGDPPRPAEGWGWAYSPIYGWVVVPPGGGGKPQPPASTEPERKK